MEGIESSDLEEGEISENESDSTKNEEFEKKGNYNTQSFDKNGFQRQVEFLNEKGGTNGYLVKVVREDYVSKASKKKYKRNNRKVNGKSYKFYYISSSGEGYESEENPDTRKYVSIYEKREKFKRKCPDQYMNGTAEDIMSQIGQTICRKSHCNYKKRRSKDWKYKLDKISYGKVSSYGEEDGSKYFCGSKSKRHSKRKISCSESGSEEDDPRRKRWESRKKKRKGFYCEDGEVDTGGKKVRDFDEVRRNLLEQLKKQKEEEAKREKQEAEQESEYSEIQEVEMMIDSTNYVDNPEGHQERSEGGRETEVPKENDGDDEMDLVRLRLIALASNKRKKEEKDEEVSSGKVDDSSKESPLANRDDEDLERYELLLRAEALKTALLKKQFKILKKFRNEKSEEGGTGSEDDELGCGSGISKTVSSSEEKKGDFCEVKIDAESYKENVNKGVVKPTTTATLENEGDGFVEARKAEGSEISDKKPKRVSRTKYKRKKRKSVSSVQGDIKENNDKVKEVLDEDEGTLRSQLLFDLIKKKSLKDSEKKSVLMESMQTSSNMSFSVTNLRPKEGVRVGGPVAKKNVLKKVNVPKMSKGLTLPRVPGSDIKRIIVHLGSDDSSEDDFEEPKGRTDTQMPKKDVKGTEEAKKGSGVPSIEESIRAKYERSIDLLLSKAQKMTELELEKIKRNAVSTPEAVYKHLPPSQRLEYIRLKQKIAERERLKTARKEVVGSDSKEEGLPLQGIKANAGDSEGMNGGEAKPVGGEVGKESGKVAKILEYGVGKSSTSGSTPSSTAIVHPTDKSSNFFSSLKNPNGRFMGKGLTKKYISSSTKTKVMQPHQQKNIANKTVIPPTQPFISKLKLLLKKIKIEKSIEENYEKEIVKLKNQLGLFEKKKSEQRFKIKKLAEESTKIYGMIQKVTAAYSGKQSDEGKSKEEKRKSKGEKVEADVKVVATHEVKMETEEIAVAKAEESKMNQEVETMLKPELETTLKSEMEMTLRREPMLTPEAETTAMPEEVGEEKDTERPRPEEEPQKEIIENGGSRSQMASPANGKEEAIVSSSAGCVELPEYNSPLEVFSKVSDMRERVDPNVIMCQHDLMGICKDEECTYQHLRAP